MSHEKIYSNTYVLMKVKFEGNLYERSKYTLLKVS